MVYTKKEYKLVDVEGLSTLLAEEDWKKDTSNVHTDDLYSVNSYVQPDGSVKVVKEVRPYWASNFFAIKEAYLELMHQFTKTDEDAVREEKSTGTN